MALATIKQVAQAALTATTTTVLYTAPAATSLILKEVVLCNTDTVSRTVTMQVGGGTAVANRILNAVSLAANETKIFTFSTILTTGQTVTAGASVGAVIGCTVSGVEVA